MRPTRSPRLRAQMHAQAGNPPGEDYLARVAQLNALRKQAEEIVLADLALLLPERDATDVGARPNLPAGGHEEDTMAITKCDPTR